MEYKSRLVIFPRRSGKAKHGDADAATIAEIRGQQLQQAAAKAIIEPPAAEPAVTFIELTDVRVSWARTIARCHVLTHECMCVCRS